MDFTSQPRKVGFNWYHYRDSYEVMFEPCLKFQVHLMEMLRWYCGNAHHHPIVHRFFLSSYSEVILLICNI
ncbi:hypothetical protein FRX31_026071 [Thalictrum thalictroides]|uniref:Uncharacterized protein n=1 Tax=Thalictrum thalictroides TaxID=46969 RepID=A0A7J6VHF0_THATH|nr:hypothetical protein FRX31_026071 [Thalictrum thalictroides]